jgi:hypothetical protein
MTKEEAEMVKKENMGHITVRSCFSTLLFMDILRTHKMISVFTETLLSKKRRFNKY